MSPTITHEQAWHARGYSNCAGIDEAGRGCWAGPVVAAAVVLAPSVFQQPDLLAGVNDSKQLDAATRGRLFGQIHHYALGVGVGIVPAYLIDAYGIVPATRLAMLSALLSLPCRVDALLIDALTLPDLSLPQEALIKGDARSLSIAAASVVAKVTRDHLMQTADHVFPGYGFAAHKGYGTAAHQRALAIHGSCALHRRTFQPLLTYDI
ncbi:ribonuclease H [Oscillochloris trichoides DG-6]|uniref:Ribonuclease HII n=1 Tax=Oscillochloris trichoides DG-6 TaxID=765420 RepID=E1IBC0_9CHLR|nr:ribonuclease HII [Oscillochloris trichoides]EFO81477.1 ribonuclease H [Oscillochloris trichoides DG-6]